jgi:hypothetical protein
VVFTRRIDKNIFEGQHAKNLNEDVVVDNLQGKGGHATSIQEAEPGDTDIQPLALILIYMRGTDPREFIRWAKASGVRDKALKFGGLHPKCKDDL